jgi:hypothetical protein
MMGRCGSGNAEGGDGRWEAPGRERQGEGEIREASFLVW